MQLPTAILTISIVLSAVNAMPSTKENGDMPFEEPQPDKQEYREWSTNADVAAKMNTPNRLYEKAQARLQRHVEAQMVRNAQKYLDAVVMKTV